MLLITENQLDNWVRGNVQDAQAVITELIRRLVAASCPKPRESRFPLGDSIGQHGPDGVLDVDIGSDPFVPEGRSYWEIGAGSHARDKATSDYDSRTKSIPEHIRHQSTFIFVTPLSGQREWKYTWDKNAQADWVEERRARGEWKDVRVIDGTKLVDWVHHYPAVEQWLAHKMGLPVQQIGTPEERWAVLRRIGGLSLTPQVFLLNREEAYKKLQEVFTGTIRLLKLQTYFPDQVVDFVAAYLATLDEETRADVAGRCLVISEIKALNIICEQYSDHILIAAPTIDLSGHEGAILLGKAEKAGHSIIYSGLPGGIPNENAVSLPQPKVYQLSEALEKSGCHEEQARLLAQRSGGNLSTLLKLLQNISLTPEWAQGSDAADLAIAVLLGAWNEKYEADCKIAETLAGKPYAHWVERMREFTHRPNTPLTYQDGKWKFAVRYEGWYALGPRLFDEHLDRLRSVMVTVLREKDPKFDLPADERYAAQIHGKVLAHSQPLREGLAESLALLGSHPGALTRASFSKAEETAIFAVRQILSDADWVLWASLNDVLPLLAEAAPGEFLNVVEKALNSDPCPFDEVFAQEGDGLMGRTYMSGLLWALETLAWDANHLSRVLICLGELAARDLGGRWANRPANSLTTILLPWLPQTCASVDKRVAAVKTLLSELPDMGWKLLLSLLPQSHSMSLGSRRPAWRETIPDDWEKGVTHQEYWQQVSSYAELTVTAAGHDTARLAELIDHFDSLPQPAFDQLLQVIASQPISALPEEQRLSIWHHLTKFTNKHRRFSDAKWALPDKLITRIEQVSKQLAPTDPFHLYQPLFTDRDFDLYEENGDWEEQRKKLDTRREKAICEIFQQNGAEGVIRFAESVSSPAQVGHALGVIADSIIERSLLPHFLDSPDNNRKALVSGFIWRRYHQKGWKWCDDLDKSNWTPQQIGQFLACLPFTKEAWDRASEWLKVQESEYWTRTGANAYQAEGDLAIAIEKLIKHGRPHAAINCLDRLRHAKEPIDSNQCVRALLAALSSSEPSYAMNRYSIVELIKFLQAEPSVNQDDLFKVEWAYLPLLDRHSGAAPEFLESKLANDPDFFCEVIQLIYRSKKEDQPEKEPTEKLRAIATNAWRLLHEWKTPPGMQKDGSFSAERFTEWLQRVKEVCTESGHLEVALIHIGKVLIYTPPDPDGLWIHRAVADELNHREADAMCTGFSTGTYNSRGVHCIDPSGKPERELAEQFRSKAEEIENAGFQRFAVTLRGLANVYDREAERIVAEQRGEES